MYTLETSSDFQNKSRKLHIYSIANNFEFLTKGVLLFLEQSTNEEIPKYELRRKRSSIMPTRDFSHHVDAITAFDVS